MRSEPDTDRADGSQLLLWIVASLAVAALAVGGAIGLGAHARQLAHQRDAARAERDRIARDAARAVADANAASSAAVRSLDARLAQALDQLDALRTALAQTTIERDAAQRRRQQSLEELTALRAQLDTRIASSAAQRSALLTKIEHAEAQLATLTDQLNASMLAQAQSLVALAEAELALGDPSHARDHAEAAARITEPSSPPALRAVRVQIRALIQLRDPAALELASALADRLGDQPDTPIADQLVVEAMLAQPEPDPAELIAKAERVLEVAIEAHGPDSPRRWRAASLLGEALTRAGRPARAARVLAEALKAQLAAATLDDPDARLTQVRLAEAMIALDRIAEGQALLTIVIQADRPSSTSPIAARAQHDLDALAPPADTTRLASESDDPP